MTHVLGISAFFHDSAAALVSDGEIVAAAQEERFTRVKHDAGYPERAVRYCLDQAGIRPRDLDAVVFYECPHLKFERLTRSYLTSAPKGFASFRRAMSFWVDEKLHIPERLRRELGTGFRGEVRFVEHHESHAASAFFPSPFEEAAILTLDAVGEWSTSAYGVGQGHRLELSHEMRFPHSLGMLYSAFTHLAGFKVNSGEYKVMGLAPYGRPIYRDRILEHLVRLEDDGSLWMDMSYFDYLGGDRMTSPKLHDLFDGPPRPPEGLITQREMDLAASIQAVCEEAVLRAGAHVHARTGMGRLVMAGGVALNCVANGRLLREGPFEDIWVQPAAGDAGGALGAALHYWHQELGNPRVPAPSDSQKGSLLGPSFGNEEIECFLESVGASYHRSSEEAELLDQIAAALDEGKTVGWFHGRMEFGPRALGCRSIIGDPRSPEMQRTMNLKVKFRESFRPFAPCVLREFVDEAFEAPPGADWPYMLMVAPVHPRWRRELGEDEKRLMEDPDLRVRVSVPRSAYPAITHVDHSARIQTVDEDRHGRFYRLMRRFHERTGCPIVVNTSFNIRGEPIVCTPVDAFRCFMATDLDVLVLEDHVLRKEDQPPGLLVDAVAYRARFQLD